ncbi:MAG: 4-phosphopantetheinyl transferase superfamily protein, partial [Humibacillus sp.]|nr:4-phosphopantetheinyl transferase superfamily protein [Humibacillus sp.]
LLARDVLGRVVGVDPSALTFARTCDRCGQQHGPPRLVGHPKVQVSLARTAGLVAVAVSTVGPVGVDVELVAATDFAGFDAVATHPADRSGAVDRLGRARGWVRKEAALKALGVGLRADPATVRELVPGQARAVLPGHPSVVVTDLDLTAVLASAGHVAALGLVVNRGRPLQSAAANLEVVVHPA